NSVLDPEAASGKGRGKSTGCAIERLEILGLCLRLDCLQVNLALGLQELLQPSGVSTAILDEPTHKFFSGGTIELSASDLENIGESFADNSMVPPEKN